MKCEYHPEREAVGKCADCGKEICNLCLTTTAFNINAAHLTTPLADKHYCPTCIEKLIGKHLEFSPEINVKPIAANDTSSKQNLTTETFSQKTAHTPSDKEPAQEYPRGWNWGAFFWGLIWVAFNGAPAFVWILWFVPGVGICIPFVLGAYGNKWAWEKGKWRDLDHFRRTQRKWAYYSLALIIVYILFCILVVVWPSP